MAAYDQYLKNFDECVSSYIPPKESWTPSDEALYKPKDLYRIPLKEAEELQLKSIKFTFKHHYEKNKFYHDFCKEHKVEPNDIKNISDLLKIPLVPDGFYKDYPHGKDFATWLGNIFTGELPKIVIPHSTPNYDQVIDAFSKAGVIVTYSSGTGGRHTFIPRDIKTFQSSEYALAKSVVSMIYPFWQYDSNGYILMPNPKKNFIYAGKALEIYMDAVKNMRVAIDRHINTETIRITMGIGRGIRSKFIRFASKRVSRKMIDDIISWMERYENSDEKISMIGAPFILYFAMKKIQERGIKFDFGERGAVVTGGGWKIHEQTRMTSSLFRKMVKEVLGIPEKFCIDAYGMVEGNGWMVQCPEGHYLHVPYSYFKPLVLDDEFNQVGYGEAGRFAFLDALSMSYPGFITTGDKVKLLEHCPVCDRPGPVLDPEVKRVKGAETRGCAEEMRSMMTRDIGR